MDHPRGSRGPVAAPAAGWSLSPGFGPANATGLPLAPTTNATSTTSTYDHRMPLPPTMPVRASHTSAAAAAAAAVTAVPKLPQSQFDSASGRHALRPRPSALSAPLVSLAIGGGRGGDAFIAGTTPSPQLRPLDGAELAVAPPRALLGGPLTRHTSTAGTS